MPSPYQAGDPNIQGIPDRFAVLLGELVDQGLLQQSDIESLRSDSAALPDDSLRSYTLFIRSVERASKNWLVRFESSTRIHLDPVASEKLIQRMIQEYEWVANRPGQKLLFDSSGAPLLRQVEPGGQYLSISLSDYAVRTFVESHIGCLNGRSPFISYVCRGLRQEIDRGESAEAMNRWIIRQYRFWAELLRQQLAAYDQMRDERNPLAKRPYVFTNAEFDDLFRICPNPEETFEIDLDKPVDAAAIVPAIAAYLTEHRESITVADYPMGMGQYYVRWIRFLWRHWSEVFRNTPAAPTRTVQYPHFWPTTIKIWAHLNLVLNIAVAIGISNVSGVYIVPFAIFGVLMGITFLPLSYRAVLSVGRAYVGLRLGQKTQVMKVKTWNGLIRHASSVRQKMDPLATRRYEDMLGELFLTGKITQTQRLSLEQFDFSEQPGNEEARRRLIRWANTVFMRNVPSLPQWSDVSSVTVMVSSLDEKFSYHWEELVAHAPDQVGSILGRLQRTFPDEWERLVGRLTVHLSPEDIHTLDLAATHPELTLQDAEAVQAIEQWANSRLQTLRSTLDGTVKIRQAYIRLASTFFPNAGLPQIEALVSQKVQIIFMHELYPTYVKESAQRRDIDAYLQQHPYVQICWPKDIVHHSKYGAWAYAIWQVKNEFLFTLDSDHCIDQEEADMVPYALREFEENPNLAGLQYRLYSYTSHFSVVAMCMAMAEDTWWGFDLRVKNYLGGIGLYGKTIFRVDILKRFEGLQDDSLAEDVLTSVRLMSPGFETKFVDYVQIGQGNDITHGGVSVPLRRYPIGGVESSLYKTFVEFLLSPHVMPETKIETLMMAAYYPTQPFIIWSTLAYIIGAYVLPFNPYIFLPTIFLVAGLFVAEAVNIETLAYLIENFGFWRGTAKFLALFPVLTLFHVSFVPHYYERMKMALKGYAKFIVTKKLSSLSHESWKVIYERNRFGIKLGAFLTTLILVTPFEGQMILGSALFIINSLVWLSAPFMFNPARSPLEKMLDCTLGVLWAYLTALIELTLGWLLSFVILQSVHGLARAERTRVRWEGLDRRFANLLKRAVGVWDLWRVASLGYRLAARDYSGESWGMVLSHMDATILGKIEITDLVREIGLLPEWKTPGKGGSPLDGILSRGPPQPPPPASLPAQTSVSISPSSPNPLTIRNRGPPLHPTRVSLVNLFSPSHRVLTRALGIEALAGDLAQTFGDHVSVQILDMQTMEENQIIAELGQTLPDIIGLSAKIGSYEQLKHFVSALEEAPWFKTRRPMVALGNVLATFAPEELLLRHPDVLAVIGEGELALRDLVRFVSDGQPALDQIPNLAYRKEGQVFFTERKAMNLEEFVLPSHATVPTIIGQSGHIWLEASRGCNGHCTFCSRRPIRNTGWEPLPAVTVVEEVRTLVSRYGVKHLRFSDDDFMGSGSPFAETHVREILAGIKDLGITFDISARVDSIYQLLASPEENQQKLELYRELRAAGLTQVFLGIESGSAGQLKRFAKGISVEENRRAIELFRELGIQVVAGFITIDNLISISELGENIRFLQDTNAMSEQTGVFVSDPLSCLRAQAGSSYLKLMEHRHLLGPRDESMISYDGGYKDPRIARIVEVISGWRKETYPMVYALKNRASLASMAKNTSQERVRLENFLHRFKELDIILLDQLTQLMAGFDPTDIDEGQVQSVYMDLRRRKTELINELPQDLREGRMVEPGGAVQKVVTAILPALLLGLLAWPAVPVRAAQQTADAVASAVAQDTPKTGPARNFISWLSAHADSETGLPYSHIGDERFLNWTMTYDAAVTAMAWTATNQPEKAQKIIDFYLQNDVAWRLGGIIEAVNAPSAALGEDWSVRTGSNLWMGLAAIHLYHSTRNPRDLVLARRLGDFALSLQETSPKNPMFGGVRLGPAGGPNTVGDQHLDYDAHRPSFTDIYATEINVDAYALFDLLFQKTHDNKYRVAGQNILHWLKTVAYNSLEHRFNRGFKSGLDTAVATDVQSWGVSALGVDVLDTFEPNLAEKMIAFVENHCMSDVEFQKPDGSKVTVRGVDFVDHPAAASLGRKPLVSPEWTFQLINAYRRLESDFARRGDVSHAALYRHKREELSKSILSLAIPTSDGWAYPYATQGDAQIGHGYRTPVAGALSTIGAAYAVLGLTGFDPLVSIPAAEPTRSNSGKSASRSPGTYNIHAAA
jgi:hypothetical protein